MNAVSATQVYRWFLLDDELRTVADGSVQHATLVEAISGIEKALAALPSQGIHPHESQEYRLMIYQGSRVVAVRPPSIGIC